MFQKKFKKTPKQLEADKLLTSKTAVHIMFDGGSRSGKTFLLIRAIIIRALKAAGSRHVALRKHFASIKRSVWYDTLPKVLDLCFKEVPVEMNKSDWFIRFPNKSEVWFGGLDEKQRTEKIFGNEYSTMFFNEASELDYESVSNGLTRLAQKTSLKNRVYYDCNPPGKKHWLYKVFFQHLNPLTNVEINKELYARLQMNPFDNKSNLPEGYMEEILANLPERKRKRFLDGEWLDDVEGALWNRDTMINPYRVTLASCPELVRILIGVDPAVSTKITSSDTGIVSVGMSKNKHFYVQRDSTVKGSPLEWANIVNNLYGELSADKVIGESNQGGDLVEANLRHVNPLISYKSVHATRGKIKRAEPIANLYEQGRVHHIGMFPDLEDELCSYNPENEENDESPNRLDALVWAMTELAGIGKSAGVW